MSDCTHGGRDVPTFEPPAGYEWGWHDAMKVANERIAELEEAICDLWPRASFTMTGVNRASWEERLAALGIEVDA